LLQASAEGLLPLTGTADYSNAIVRKYEELVCPRGTGTSQVQALLTIVYVNLAQLPVFSLASVLTADRVDLTAERHQPSDYAD